MSIAGLLISSMFVNENDEVDKLFSCFTWTCDCETKLLIDSALEFWSLRRPFCTEGRSFNNGSTSVSSLMLTGDNSGTGSLLAGEVGSDKLFSCFTWTFDSN